MIRDDRTARGKSGQPPQPAGAGAMDRIVQVVLAAIIILMTSSARAELPWEFDQHTRYMALGDSLAAGYGAVPATQGYVYLLYQSGVFDRVPNLILANTGVPRATSQDVLDYQVPQALKAFRPTVVTLTVGGNDLLSILEGAEPATVLFQFGVNLSRILEQLLVLGFPPDTPPLDSGTAVYVSNLYAVPLPGLPQVEPVIQALNRIIDEVTQQFAVLGYPVVRVNVYDAFKGRKGLLLIERKGANLFEVHPTNAGHRVMAQAFAEAVGSGSGY